MSTRQFYNTPMSSLIPTEVGGGGSTFYDLTPLTEQQREQFNDLFALTPPLNFVETHMWFGKKPVGFFGTGNYKLFLQNGTFTMQAGTTYRVRVVGGGGGGGISGSGSSTMYGGGGGGYSEKIITCKTTEAVNIIVGAGGAAGIGTTTTNGQAGGTSSFGTYLSATGGGGGSTSTVSGGKGAGGDINYTGGGCSGGSGGASAASDFGNGISKTTGAGGNGLQSSATGFGGGGLFGNSTRDSGGGLWGNATNHNRGGGMFVDDGGACYTGSDDGVYTLELVQPQKYKTSNSAESQQNSFLQKDARQGLLKNNYEFTTRPMFGMGGSYSEVSSSGFAIVKAGFGGGGLTNVIPGWGGGWGSFTSSVGFKEAPNYTASRPYGSFWSGFGGGSGYSEGIGGNGAGVITGGEMRLIELSTSTTSIKGYSPQGGLGGGGGGSCAVPSGSIKVKGNPGGYGAVLVEW